MAPVPALALPASPASGIAPGRGVGADAWAILLGYRRAPGPAQRHRALAGFGLPRPGFCMEPPDSLDEQRRADLALMQAVAAGDRAAFAGLMAGHSPALLRFAVSLLASLAEAEEVVQETFLRCWRLAGGWRPEARLTTWLHRIAYNLCVDRLRRRRPSVAIETVAEMLRDAAPGQEEAMIAGDAALRLRAALARLPERQRTAIALAHFQELPQAEAAAVMAIGEHAYESLLARARRRLRALLSDEDLEGEGEGEG